MRWLVLSSAPWMAALGVFCDAYMLQYCCKCSRGSAGALKLLPSHCHCMAHQLNMHVQVEVILTPSPVSRVSTASS